MENSQWFWCTVCGQSAPSPDLVAHNHTPPPSAEGKEEIEVNVTQWINKGKKEGALELLDELEQNLKSMGFITDTWPWLTAKREELTNK